MPTSQNQPEENLVLLKYLRDHDYIQGIDCVSQDTMKSAIGWEESRLKRVLDSCQGSHCVGLLPSSAVYITAGGLRMLLMSHC